MCIHEGVVILVYIFLLLAILLSDQVIKYFVRQNFFPHQSLPLLEDIFHITYVRNPGGAFGIMAHRPLFFVLASSVVLLILIYLYFFQLQGYFRLALVLIMAGAASNLIDRLAHGYVIDYLDFPFWPVFNLADTSIVVGALLFIYLEVT